MTLVAAADGSALGNPGPAGWAWVIDRDQWRAGGWPRATNNQGELMAVLDLLRTTADRDEPLRILCDSQYVIKSVTEWLPGWKRRGWRKADGKPVLNRDLLEALDLALAGRDVEFEWVKGHAGHPLNEAADARARAAATAYQRGVEPDPGPGLQGLPVAAPTESPADRAPAEVKTPALFDLDAPQDPLAEVLENERSLRSRAVRANRMLLSSLLHPEFSGIDPFGRVFSREEAADAFNAPESEGEPAVVEALPVTADTIHIVFRSNGQRPTVGSSLWQLEDGAYRLRFHQRTFVAD